MPQGLLSVSLLVMEPSAKLACLFPIPAILSLRSVHYRIMCEKGCERFTFCTFELVLFVGFKVVRVGFVVFEDKERVFLACVFFVNHCVNLFFLVLIFVQKKQLGVILIKRSLWAFLQGDF